MGFSRDVWPGLRGGEYHSLDGILESPMCKLFHERKAQGTEGGRGGEEQSKPGGLKSTGLEEGTSDRTEKSGSDIEGRAPTSVSVGKLAKVKHKSPTTWQWGRNWIGIPEAFREMSHSKGGNEFLEKVEKKATFLQG